MDLNTKLTNLKDLYCSECNNFLNSPIMLMKNAENICGRCFSSRVSARSDYTPNLALENIIKNLINPCRYKSDGCTMQLTYTEIAAHETACKYRKHKCPSTDCHWSGELENILDHYQLAHQEGVIQANNNLFNFSIDISDLSKPRENLLVWNNELFFLVIYVCNEMICFVLNYLRLEEQPNGLEYCIEEIGDTSGICFKNNNKLPIPDMSTQAHVEATKVDLRILRMCKTDILTVKLRISGDGSEQVDENILAQLECPICDTYMFPPINQCLVGHSICNKCRPKLGQCPTCRGRIENTRNYALENLTIITKYPCVNRTKGCGVVVPGSLLEKHEQECKFQDFACPNNTCAWRGRTTQLMSHLKQQHELRDSNEVKITLPQRCTYNIPTGNLTYNTFIAYGEIFKVGYRYTSNTTTWWACKVVGAKNRNKFMYDIVYSNQNPDCDLVKREKCEVFTKDEDFFDKCLNFTQNLTSLFGNVVTCKIYRNFDS